MIDWEAVSAVAYGAAMGRLTPLRYEQLDQNQADVWEALTTSRDLDLIGPDGSLIGPFNAFVHVPRVGRRLASLGGHLRFRTSIERRLTEVAICTVGAHWRAEFEFFAHAPMALEHGIDPAVLDALCEGRTPEFAHPDEQLVHAITTQLLIDRRVDDATFAAGEELLGEAGMIELASLVGYYCLISMILNLFEVPLPDGEPPRFADA